MKRGKGMVNFNGSMDSTTLETGKTDFVTVTVFGLTEKETAIMDNGSKEEAKDTEFISSTVILFLFRSVIQRVIC